MYEHEHEDRNDPDGYCRLGLESPVALCSCRRRAHEWRLRGEAVDVVSCTYLSRDDFIAAVAAGRKVIRKGKASGWAYETAPLGHGHPWTCMLCHPPADGLDVEYREPEAVAGAVRGGRAA